MIYFSVLYACKLLSRRTVKISTTRLSTEKTKKKKIWKISYSRRKYFFFSKTFSFRKRIWRFLNYWSPKNSHFVLKKYNDGLIKKCWECKIMIRRIWVDSITSNITHQKYYHIISSICKCTIIPALRFLWYIYCIFILFITSSYSKTKRLYVHTILVTII